MQIFVKLRIFIRNLLNPSTIQGRSIRLTVDTDGEVFICRLPELSLSATDTSIGEAYENLRGQIRDADFAFNGTTDKEVLSEISAIQAIDIFNRKVRKKSVVFLSISILFFFITIAVVPILDTKYFVSTIAINIPRYIPRIADRIERIDPQNKEQLREDISTIREFLDDVLSDNKDER